MKDKLFITRKIVVTLATITLVLSSFIPAFAVSIPESSSPLTSPKPGVQRIYGSNKYTTATTVADELKKEWGISKFDAVIVTSGESYHDALSGSYLASKYHAPILLVSNSKYSVTLNYIKKNLNKDGKIYIIGGPVAVSNQIEQALKRYGHVIRLQGRNAIATNLAVLKSEPLDGHSLVLCSSKDYSDAVATASTGHPILMVGNSLTSQQKSFLKAQAAVNGEIFIAGGPVAIPESIAKELQSCGFSKVTRVAGKNKYSTAIALAKKFYPKAKQEVLATGDDFSDALVGSVLACAKGAPLLLTTRSAAFKTTFNFTVTNNIKYVTIIGGPKAVDADASGITSSGSKITGFITVGDKKYYANKNNKIVTDTIFSSGGNKYYAKSNGVIATGTIVSKDGNTYAASSTGVLTKANKIIYLTFDDGPGPYTQKLLNILNKYGAKATFFVNPYRTSYRYLIGQAYRSGHAIGNHTYSHAWSVYSSASAFWADIDNANSVIKDQTGSPSKLIRFPGGSSNTISRNYSRGIMTTLTRQAAKKGYVYFDWDVDSYDAGGATSSAAVYRNIINGVSGKKTSIVLCHDIKSYTVNAIEDVIKWGQKNGYVFLPLTTSTTPVHHGVAN